MSSDNIHPSIAVIGLSCRFPGAKNVKEFWHNLVTGEESIRFFSTEELREAGVIEELLQHPHYVKASPALAEIDKFDASFFGLTPNEAKYLDPQKRLFLETVWEVLEDAGYTPTSSEGWIGVYGGSALGRYRPPHFDATSLFANFQDEIYFDKDFLSTYVSYKLNLKGPSLNIQTACSTSLVAVCLACQDLLGYQCDLALAGGVSLQLPQTGYLYEPGGIESPDGHCRAFDATSQGTIFGSGAGVVALKRLEEAIEDGDHIYAVIRGMALNNDGAQKAGYTAPSQTGQSQVITLAQQIADVLPETISYIETHGTGTRIGDPIEIAALTEAFRRQTHKKQFCAIGSVKTNVGHLNTAAGIAALIKTVLALHHRQIPASLHFNTPNPAIDFANSPFYVNTTLTDWQTQHGIPRRAGVSSFGIGGTNAHVVLEEAPHPQMHDFGKTAVCERSCHLLTLSGKTEQALVEQVNQYLDHMHHVPQANLANMCYVANTGRVHFEQRLAVVAKDTAELTTQLVAIQQGKKVKGCVTGRVSAEKPRVAFLFTGQGSQYVNMGRELYDTHPLFRESMEECDQILRSYLELPLLELLYGGQSVQETDHLLSQTQYTQPVLFAIEYALAKLWQAWGIEPTVVIGHSVGEYVAACIAGVFSLTEGLKLIAERGRLIQALPQNGLMVAIQTDEANLSPVIEPYRDQVSIAGYNAPQSLVLSGEKEVLHHIIEQLQTMGIKCKPLKVSHAFHSPLMAPMLTPFSQVAQTIHYAAPQLKWVSNLTGELLTDVQAEYWVEHVRQPVRFAQGMMSLEQMGIDTFIEIGPRPILIGLGQQCLSTQGEKLWLPSLYPPQQSDWSQILESLAKWHVQGGHVEWSAFDKPYPRQRLSLPTYPFQRQRYWAEKAKAQSITAPRPVRNGYSLLGEQLPQLATSQDIAFQSHLSAHSPAYLADYRLYGQIIVPMSAYLEMVWRASKVLDRGKTWVVEHVVLSQPLLLSEEHEHTVQLVLSPRGESYLWQIFSLAPDTQTWLLHVKGELNPSLDHQPEQYDSLPILQERCKEKGTLNADHSYLPKAFDCGPAFQGINQLFKGEKEALGRVELPGNMVDHADHLHPVLLECSLQIGGLLFQMDNREMPPYLPYRCERMQYFSQTSSTMWSYVKWREESLIDVFLFNEESQVVAKLSGLSLQQTDHQVITKLTHHSTLQQPSLISTDEQPKVLKEVIRTEIKQIVGTVPPDEQNFFSLGMDSLMLIRLTNRLNSILHLSLSLQTLLDHNTVEQLAQQLEVYQLVQIMGDSANKGQEENEESYEEGIL